MAKSIGLVPQKFRLLLEQNETWMTGLKTSHYKVGDEVRFMEDFKKDGPWGNRYSGREVRFVITKVVHGPLEENLTTRDGKTVTRKIAENEDQIFLSKKE